jgi:hypothetical protein
VLPSHRVRHLRRHWVTRGLDQRKSDLSDLRIKNARNRVNPVSGGPSFFVKGFFAKKMDCRVISAFTRVSTRYARQ